MSGRRASLADLDDAAFRARLAPLSQEVLPGTGHKRVAGTRDANRPALRLAPTPLPGQPHELPAAEIQSAYRSALRRAPPPPPPERVRASASMPAAEIQDAYRSKLRRRGVMLPLIAVVAVLLLAGGAYLALSSPYLAMPSFESRNLDVASRNFDAASGALPMRDAAVLSAASAGAVQRDDMVRVLLQRGDAALATGDITGARLLYESAAAQGSALAAANAGKTYDPAFLHEIGARGIQADPAMAAEWYRKAAALGDPASRERLSRMEGAKPP